MPLIEQVFEYLEWGVQQRRYLHQIPELGRGEYKTSAYCQKIFQEMGYQVKPSFSTGFIADLRVSDDLDMIAFRADMDALPVNEQLDADYKSTHEGVAHLCGHDVHMAVALTAARFMAEHQCDLKYNVRFIFQPSEEMFVGGAQGMIDAGCLDGVKEVYGLHNDPTRETGEVHLCPGAISSNGDSFEIRIRGKCAHASTPDQGMDAIREACRFISEFDSIVANNCSPMQPALIAVGTLNAGETPNSIAANAVMQGSIRSFDERTHKTLLRRVRETIDESERRGFAVNMELKGYPAIINEQYGVDRIIHAAERIMERENIITDCKPMAGSEDFSFFTQQQKGGFFFLGSGNQNNGISAPLHSNPLLIDERCIGWGAAVFVSLSI